MKASSAGLEIDINLSDEEVKELSKKSLQCMLRFDDTMLHGTTKREMLLTLRYVQENKDDILAEKYPEDCYFGNSNNCAFTIYNYHYQSLLRNGFAVDRFFSSGKLTIRSPKHL